MKQRVRDMRSTQHDDIAAAHVRGRIIACGEACDSCRYAGIDATGRGNADEAEPVIDARPLPLTDERIAELLDAMNVRAQLAHARFFKNEVKSLLLEVQSTRKTRT